MRVLKALAGDTIDIEKNTEWPQTDGIWLRHRHSAKYGVLQLKRTTRSEQLEVSLQRCSHVDPMSIQNFNTW